MSRWRPKRKKTKKEAVVAAEEADREARAIIAAPDFDRAGVPATHTQFRRVEAGAMMDLIQVVPDDGNWLTARIVWSWPGLVRHREAVEAFVLLARQEIEAENLAAAEVQDAPPLEAPEEEARSQEAESLTCHSCGSEDLRATLEPGVGKCGDCGNVQLVELREGGTPAADGSEDETLVVDDDPMPAPPIVGTEKDAIEKLREAGVPLDEAAVARRNADG